MRRQRIKKKERRKRKEEETERGGGGGLLIYLKISIMYVSVSHMVLNVRFILN